MHRMTVIAAIAGLTAGFALADSWSGKLIDANCKSSNNSNSSRSNQDSATCAPTSATRVFAIQTPDGKVYRLDSSGNRKAEEMMKNDPNRTNVTVNGSLQGQTVKVDSLDLR